MIKKNNELNSPLSSLPGVGPKITQKLNNINLFTFKDALFHLPYRYVDRTKVTKISDLKLNNYVVIEGEIESVGIVFSKRRTLICRISDNYGSVIIKFYKFNNSQKSQFIKGAYIRCFGIAHRGKSSFEFYHPEYSIMEKSNLKPLETTLSPIYPTTIGLSQNKLRDIIKGVLDHLCINQTDVDFKPLDSEKLIVTKFSSSEALKFLHNPPSNTDLDVLESRSHPMQKILSLEELTAYQIGLLSERKAIKSHTSKPMFRDLESEGIFLNNLNFKMTSAQTRVIKEIADDISSTKPMHRLVQGDVGSGKTIVAAFCSLQILLNNKQVAIMAPTEILAEQHRLNFLEWLSPFKYQIDLLSSKVKGKLREEVYQKIEDGSTQVIIGTHALFQENVKYSSLGLVIIDEQHRFGVNQRLTLLKKGFNGPNDFKIIPNQLVMTATPIPRTLAMSAYADLDFSVIDELPPGRQPIKTSVLSDQKRDGVIKRIKDLVIQGNQVYWVCTLIEESDALEAEAAKVISEELQLQMPAVSIGLVHGKLKAREKLDIMDRFKRKDINVLVATTVIEVGVDVPDATVMVIENAERLGLSQLHQLRGRVGRGSKPSYCILMYGKKLSHMSRQRMEIMRETNDGFKIAEKDLAIRGAGEILGTRQTGDIGFKIADLSTDASLLPLAKQNAEEIIDNNPDLGQKIVNNWLPRGNEFSLA